MPSPTQETPSSTVNDVPQSEGDFGSWLTDRLEKFEKGEETPPWEQKQADEPAAEAEAKDEEPKSTEEESSDGPEAAAEAEDEDSKNMSASAGTKFKELKSELKTYKTRVSELEKAVEEAKSASQNSEEVESLRSQLAEYEREISVTRVEASPTFKRAVLEPTQAILDTASSMAERYKIDARKLVNALREESVTEGSDALTELAGDFSERDRVRLYRMADDLADVSRRRDYLRENASAAYAEQQEQAKSEELRMEQAYKEQAAKASESVWKNTFAEHAVLSSLDKNVLQEIQQAGGESDLLESDPDTRAYAVYSGVALPHLIKKLEAATGKVAELEGALSKYKKAAPKASGSADTSVPDTGAGGFLEAIEKRFGGV
jgi:ribosomal 50S subunit-associated protein YjgA (DUF615 family)